MARLNKSACCDADGFGKFCIKWNIFALECSGKNSFQKCSQHTGKSAGKEKENKMWKKAPSLHRTGRGSQCGSVAVFCKSVLPCRCPSFIIIIHFNRYCPPWIKAHSMTSPNEREGWRNSAIKKTVCRCGALANTMPITEGSPLDANMTRCPPFT